MSGDPQQIKTRKKPIISVSDELGDSADMCEPSSKKTSSTSHNLRSGSTARHYEPFSNHTLYCITMFSGWVRSSLLGSTDTLSTFDGSFKGGDKDRLVITNEDRKQRMYYMQ